ncbi:MAG: amidohydrolase family protein [Bradyrhizobium sp.]|jgi:L-fuconolactonase|uniref:Amidohydrolase family protein n=3 Tax=Bradyrhizobium TaxID=374 RepID=A0ABS5GG44_9BRAD|nr:MULTISPECIES: amidohydrolase family protein [Bradyrhizobium]RTL97480.1 MAG: amidohydrolase [Bradyrhizobiaceae bacterium]MBR1140293.1 amidohydrolase family protein [Bradyrhizobium denitrificans]MCL8486173.1 amidohydrolase family protein [Bradyrhizobium denitrificans]MDU0956071.1 amidohydrolase family protein [Bradyrhizobium sp.]MDU1496746.1 amidohydrolase family protein [Bradyrhizobium sp.]
MSRTIDAHQHFWDPGRADYPWMAGDALAPIRRPFGPADLAPLLAENGLDASILVQTRSSLDETEEFLRIAQETPFVAGVVGWVDLTDPQLDATIDRLRRLPGGDRLVGIRHQVHDEADPAWIYRGDVRRGLERVFAHDLTYDLLVRTRELPAAIATVRAFPQAHFVLDHAAKPPIANGFDQNWADRIAELAACGNVWCKISGLATEAIWRDWNAERLSPYVAHVARCFGPDKLIFGSDWPVCLLAGHYGAIKQALEHCLTQLGSDIRNKAFGPNTIAAYRLPA